MSILIKGMEMPKSCDECPLLTEDGDYNVCFVGKRRVMWEWKHDRGSEVIYPKPDWCPLIEVPPHGRLIDADAAIQSLPPIEDYDFAELCTIDTAKRLIRKAFDMQPIVVQADKDGET